MTYTRFAIYYVPPDGALAEFGASWLGWDVMRGRVVDHPDVPGLPQVTATPRKYGFHATLKPPFRLREGKSVDDLSSAVADLASKRPPAQSGPLEPIALGGFLALVPTGDVSGLSRIAAAFVTELDTFRAPLTEAELARRRAGHLTPEQDARLKRWGYPHVLDGFRFHMTLTGRLPKAERTGWLQTIEQYRPHSAAFTLESVALVGEREDGMFKCIQRFTLAD